MVSAKMGSTLSSVTVQMDSLEIDVKQILMIVLESFVKTMESAKMGSIPFLVSVRMDSLESDVKQILKIVSPESSVRFPLFYILEIRKIFNI